VIVLDTHVLLWMDRDDAALGGRAREQISQAWAQGQVAVSAISFWECAMLAQRGRITLPTEPEIWRADLLQAGIREIPLDGRIAQLATRLEGMHRDPADRFIVATAILNTATLLTADQGILSWQGELKAVAANE